MGRMMLVRQSIPLPEEKKTLSHVVARTASGGVLAGLGGSAGMGHGSRRRKVRVPELQSSKFLDDYDDDLDMGNLEGHFSSPIPNCVDGVGDWKNHMPTAGNRAGYGLQGHSTCPGCMGLADSVGDISRYSGPQDWHGGNQSQESTRDANSANPNLDSEDSPIMLSSSTSLERDVRELKRYVRMFVNRQKEGARKNTIAMEWRTMALVLDRLFFFVYIATIGITVITVFTVKKRTA
ncbi:unnamed protein product [Rodentolepis nana]|uniref:Neurotransmitter-gated ion-channel transmembrane domain-containing protein n=1 Tax=Rodentolepis nana TaxID=102285 RepID=A0A3P7SCZ7_RODNA|nr:unnamed protein product [Rodentolepis nana]